MLTALVVVVVVVTPSSLRRLLVILYQDFLGSFWVQGWFAIAFPFYLLIFVRSLFLVFSSTSLRHLFLSFTISFNFSKPNPVFSFMLSIHLKHGLPILNVLSSNLTRQPTYPNKRVYNFLQPLSFLPNPCLFKHVASYFLTLYGGESRYNGWK